MQHLLETTLFTYEEKNSFNHGNFPCYYSKSENGYIVFFVCSKEGDVLDYAVFNLKKKLITLVDNIGVILKDYKSQNLFISRAVQKTYRLPKTSKL